MYYDKNDNNPQRARLKQCNEMTLYERNINDGLGKFKC